MAIGVTEPVSKSFGETLSHRNQKTVVIGVAVVGGKFEEGMVSAECIYVCAEICIWKESYRGANACKAGDETLIRVAQPIFLTAEVADVGNIENSVSWQFKLRAKARLLDIRCALIGVLRVNGGLRQIV